MKPSVDDQLRQTQRLLLERVIPAVESDHAADLVRRIAADLRKLSTCWDAAEVFDAWDAAALMRLLTQLAPLLPADTLDHAGSPPEEADWQEHLRATLAAALPHLPPPARAPEAWSAVLGYFRERLARDPMTNRTASQPR